VILDSIEGKYEILGKLGEGGMGAVYKVRHRLLDELRVVKVIRPHLTAPELSDRFLREARLATQLRHPNIAQLHDFSVDEDGGAFIVMEFIDGATFEDVPATSGPPPLGLALEMAQQSLRALVSLHRKGFLHRDISPDNLMLTRDSDGGPLVKLIDLGIAKVLKGGAGLTVAGTFLGKPRYASPEQLGARGEDAMDARSDLYSFGVVLYELLTGEPPVAGSDASSLMAGHLFRPPRDFAETDPRGRIPDDLRAVVLRALAKKPEERFASAEDFARSVATVQTRFAIEPADLDRVLRQAKLGGTQPIPVVAGSTQEELDRRFAKEATPAPMESTEPMEQTLRIARNPAPEAPAVVAAMTAPAPDPPPAPVEIRPLPPRAPRRRNNYQGVAVLAVAAVLIAVWIVWLLRPQPRPATPAGAPRTAAAEETAPEPVPQESATPAAAASAEPAATVAEVAAPPAVALAPPPAPVPAAAPVETRTEARTEARTTTRTAAPTRKTAAGPPAAVATPRPASKESRVAIPVHLAGEEQARRETDGPMKKGDLILDGPGVEEAQLSESPAPAYPPGLAGSGRSAKVVLEVLVDENGAVVEARVKSATVDDGSADAEFRKAALAAARKARFEPATKHGIPGKMWGELSYEFGPKK
jgi:serine/threonine-protein kinase